MTRRAVVLAAVLAAGIGGARAMTLTAHDNTIVELLQQSQDIVVGKVTKVTDGLDEKGIPYTEVTLQVTESIRGQVPADYTFRQFGLLKPRPVADGKRTMMPAPPGFPKYAVGEDVVLMLRPSAKWTGFRMPAGVTLGKFKLGPGRVANDANNAGLFRGVQLESGLANENEKRMMKAEGPANPDTFLSFLRKAVREHWVENGRMRKADVKPTLPRSGR